MVAICPNCNHQFNIPKEYINKEIMCPKCKLAFNSQKRLVGTRNDAVLIVGIGILIVFLIVIGIAIYTINSSTSSSNDTKNSPPQNKSTTQPKRQIPTVSNITFEEVDGVYDQLDLSECTTDLQKTAKRKQFDLAVRKKYYGKLVQWTGQVAEVDTTIFDKELYVKFKHTERSLISDVTVFFPKQEKASLLKLQKGDWVTYQGEIDNITVGVFINHTLKQGRILKIH